MAAAPLTKQIPEYLKLVADGEYDEAMRVIAIDNACPTITGVPLRTTLP